jgi:hypothetical protein
MVSGLDGLNGHLAMPNVEVVFNRELELVWNRNTEGWNAQEIENNLKNVEQKQNAKVWVRTFGIIKVQFPIQWLWFI